MADITGYRWRVWADTAATLTTQNPTLLSGEIVKESDTGKMKVGDGSTAWNSLKYINGGTGSEAVTTTGSVSIPLGYDKYIISADTTTEDVTVTVSDGKFVGQTIVLKEIGGGNIAYFTGTNLSCSLEDGIAKYIWDDDSEWRNLTTITEYASNSNTADATETSYVSANNVLGNGGSLIPNIAAGTGSYARYVRFNTPYQITDTFIIDVYDEWNDVWEPLDLRLYPFVVQGNYQYGARLVPGSNKYEFVVNFGRGGYVANSTSFGVAGTPWTSLYSLGWKWCVRKVSMVN
jgi:hypothetical protein